VNADRPVEIFVDFDGTITDIDTFDALVRSEAGNAAWDALEVELHAGAITLREALRRQAALCRRSQPETLAFLEATATVDPTFGPFVTRARAAGAAVRVVSSGIGTVIHAALERAGIEIEVLANDVDFDAAGWTMHFIDDSLNGHDKAAHVHAARAAGAHTIYVGDGISDFDAAAIADQRFAKAGRRLEEYCRANGIACTPFAAFSEIERALFPTSFTAG
jgi:HAD superfamily phosphoserine phosphatase-like hydrolase